MTLRQWYYAVKPLIPRSLQIALRRRIAFRRLKSVGHVWPIDPQAGTPPHGWKGWPDQKRFALVLSHDVDTVKGHDQCLKLMELEEKLGFRSSFNFVPEGYPVSGEQRQRLTERGFGVGVHGLVHDSRLFQSRKIFEYRASRINKYLKEWGAVGFHSPAMIRNLDWIGELDIEYDGSTFDTDPFEPQPDGIRTIFPFLVARNSVALKASQPSSFQASEPSGCITSQPWSPSAPPEAGKPSSLPASQPDKCYVELPYTLPQDHCLFLILKEKDIRIWKQKLDWIVEKGGMALLNSHPDYMNFEERECELEEYPVRHYVAFLEYVKEKYKGQYWQALLGEVARFWSEDKGRTQGQNSTIDRREINR